ncbi:MAG: hypothetical protein R3C05_02665 [Pirellulaceae bacterium]
MSQLSMYLRDETPLTKLIEDVACGAIGDEHHCRLRVRIGKVRENRRIGHEQILCAVNPQVGVDDAGANIFT